MKSKKKVYISGPISGRERDDYMRQFANAAALLRCLGYRVCNPTRKLPARWPLLYRLMGYHRVLLYDMRLLLRCDYIYMLEGWETSRGARLEKATADILGIKTMNSIN